MAWNRQDTTGTALWRRMGEWGLLNLPRASEMPRSHVQRQFSLAEKSFNFKNCCIRVVRLEAGEFPPRKFKHSKREAW